ncbi:YdcF family protein [Legionella fairfieldensis]|uniref:YdcF family protein n=1 Tax=Legionella fairfieldensis TaxID=45064 RepID=UPI00048BF7E4|nr:ElyC/SanA/YdcF family protein [Legionella fairfieldensis]
MAIFRHVMEFLLNPFFLILLVFAALVVLLWLNGDTRVVRHGFLWILVLLLLFSTGWVAKNLTRRLEDQYTAVKTVDPTVRWVVVFSGGQAKNIINMPTNSLLSTVSIKRLIEGVRLYRQLPAAKLLLSGGGYGFEVPEATHLSELASWFAIPASDMVLETKSINTVDEVNAIKQIVHNDPFYLVTSAIHMPRAMKLCKEANLQAIAAPTDFTFYWDDERWVKTYLPNPYNLFYLSVAMHELLGRFWEKIQAWQK